MEKTLNHDPYKTPQEFDDTAALSSRPLHVYGSSIAVGIVVGLLLLLGGIVILRVYITQITSPVTFIAVVMTAAGMMGGIVGWRNWTRLSDIHDRQIQLRKAREALIEEYSQRATTRENDS